MKKDPTDETLRVITEAIKAVIGRDPDAIIVSMPTSAIHVSTKR